MKKRIVVTGSSSGLGLATVRALREAGATVETGVYQAQMMVSLENDGPVTILLESRGRTKP